jgi:hypothetical protein
MLLWRLIKMAKSIIYTSFSNSLARGRINFETDKFRMLLVGSSYTNLAEATKRAHRSRFDVTDYEIYGYNYTLSGVATVPGPGEAIVTIANIDDTNRDVEIQFQITTWPSVSLSTSGGIIYKFSGGTNGTNDLIGYVDFGQLYSFSNQDCSVSVNKNLKLQT